MSLVFCVLVDVFLRKTAKKDTVETRVESVQVGATHVTDTRLGLERKTRRKEGVGGGQRGEGIESKKKERTVSGMRKSSAALSYTVEWHRQAEWNSLPAESDFYLPVSHTNTSEDTMLE